MKEEFASLLTFLQREDLWILQVFITVCATLFFAYFISRLLKKLLAKAQLTKNFWDDVIVSSAQGPIRWFIWLMGISFATELLREQAGDTFLNIVDIVRDVGIITLLGWFLIRFISRAERNLIDAPTGKKVIDETTASAIGKLLRISVIVTAMLVIMQSMGYSISGILAFGGIGGLAVGFAAKDLLANFFGGLMIYLDRPFAVGDWVRSPDQNIEGTVEDIGWRLTRIRTFDKRPLYVPNATFTHISLENPSRMLNRRIYETVGIRYDDADKMSVIINDVEAMLRNHEAIDTQQTLIVNFNAFAPSSLDFFIYTFTKTTNWVEFHTIKQDVLLQILRIIESHGAQCAFPTSTVHIASTPPEHDSVAAINPGKA